MEWYEIIGVVVIWVAGVWLRGKIYEHLRNRHYNDSWKKRDK
jgi:hypothetical protein